MGDLQKLKDLSALAYAEQSKWFLNAFWQEHGGDADQIWQYTNKMIELDEKGGEDGCELDELTAHRFLESLGETLTVAKMRSVLRDIDIDNNKSVSMAEFLIYRFKVDYGVLVNAPQGNKEEITKAEALLADAQAKIAVAQSSQQAAKVSEAEAVHQENKAVAAEDHARDLEAPLKAAEEEVLEAQADLQAQEDAFNQRKSDLESASESGGMVRRNKAKHELQQLLNEDPLPLRRAKTTVGASLRKAEKARAPFKEAREAAEQVRAEAQEARAEAQQAREAADTAFEVAQQSYADAEAYLEDVKARVPQGSIWWLEKQLEEVKKYLPQSKGGKTQ